MWTVIGILLGSSALWLIKDGYYLLGGVVGLATAMVMIQVTTRASARAKPPGNLTASRAAPQPSPDRQRPLS